MAKRKRLQKAKKNQVGMRETKPDKRMIALVCIALAAVTIVAYWPVLNAEFVRYDDQTYVTENHYVLGGVSLDGIKWAFSTSTGAYSANWHPLTWLSHMLDCEFFGQDAGLHHLTNLLLHTANSVLLLLVLASMTGRLWPSAFVAAAFALHPLHVESVAWIAERKDVLSGLFWMLTMACYLRYTRNGSRSSYILTLLFFGLGLMAKPMLVTLPFVMLLLDYWPLNRLDSDSTVSRHQKIKSLIVEKMPFWVLTITSCVVTYMAQKSGGAVSDTEVLPFTVRLANASVSYVTYIVKMVWPTGLAAFYPFKLVPPWQALRAFLGLAITMTAALYWLRRKRYFTVGWLWYLGTLIPVIGFVHVGIQSHADRYTYIPLIGLFMILAWAVSDLCSNRPRLQLSTAVVSTLLLAGMFAGTRNQVAYWQDSTSLFRRAINVTENNLIMHMNLGNELTDKGQLDEAIGHYRRALKISPDFAEAHEKLGFALAEKGQLDEAIIHYRRSLQIDPENANAHNRLGFLFAGRGRMDEAIEHYRQAVQIDPDFAKAHANLGFELSKRGQLDEAVYHYQQAIRVRPRDSAALNNLAWILATNPQLRDSAEAVRLAEKACALTSHKNTKFLNTLAVAYFYANRFDEAISTAEKALELAQASGDEGLTQKLKNRIMLFQEAKSFENAPKKDEASE
jgi:tetratricopeptide (TPR) repeat protein